MDYNFVYYSAGRPARSSPQQADQAWVSLRNARVCARVSVCSRSVILVLLLGSLIQSKYSYVCKEDALAEGKNGHWS